MSDIELGVDTLDMLIAIETKLQDLIDKEDTMASDSIRDAQRGLERARRAKAKEDQELGISGYLIVLILYNLRLETNMIQGMRVTQI